MSPKNDFYRGATSPLYAKVFSSPIPPGLQERALRSTGKSDGRHKGLSSSGLPPEAEPGDGMPYIRRFLRQSLRPPLPQYPFVCRLRRISHAVSVEDVKNIRLPCRREKRLRCGTRQSMFPLKMLCRSREQAAAAKAYAHSMCAVPCRSERVFQL